MHIPAKKTGHEKIFLERAPSRNDFGEMNKAGIIRFVHLPEKYLYMVR